MSRSVQLPASWHTLDLFITDPDDRTVHPQKVFTDASGTVSVPDGKWLYAWLDYTKKQTDLSFLQDVPSDAIQQLVFDNSDFDESQLRFISHFSDLKALGMRKTKITDAALTARLDSVVDGFGHLKLVS